MNDKSYRLISTPKYDAKTNMAIDNAIFSCYKENDMPIIRFYTWEKSFTIGVSQTIENYQQLTIEYENNYSKRMTGGGVLFHGNDISYSLVLPSSCFKEYTIKQSYEKICQFLLFFYKDLGLSTNFAKDLNSIKLSKNEFCQIGFEAYDIIINQNKIGGNAQKRSKNVIFQHGSIPVIKVKNNNKNGVCLEDFNINLSLKKIQMKLIKSFEQCFNSRLILSNLNKQEKEKINSFMNKGIL